MSATILDRETTVHQKPSTDATTGLRVPISSSVDAAIERIVAAARPLSRAQRDQLATILGGGA